MAKSQIYIDIKSILKTTVFLSATLLLFTAITCQAATISLQTTSTVKVESNIANLQLTISNIGDEKAADISFTALLSDQHHEKRGLGDIQPGKSLTINTYLEIPPNSQGRLPIFIKIFYKHQNGIQKSQTLIAIAQTDANVPPPQLSLRADRQEETENKIKISIESPDIRQRLVTLTGYGSDEFTISPAKVQIELTDSLKTVTFTITPSKQVSEKTSLNLYWIAQYTTDEGILETIYTASPFTYTPDLNTQAYSHNSYLYFTSLLLCAFAFVLTTLKSQQNLKTAAAQAYYPLRSTMIIDAAVITAVICALLTILPFSDMLSQTITTGGDTASHYYTLQYMTDTLLPNGQITGWTMGNYAGFPILQFYFPLPFLLMKFLSIFIPLTVAFKLISILGVFLLPICVYVMLRDIKIPFPGPALGSTLSLLFLFHSANSMWGGNILSTLAGEFTYSISMSFSILLLGSIYRGAISNSRVIVNAVLIFLVGFSHGYPLLFIEAVSLFLLFEPKHFGQRFFYLLKTYALGFLILAFWLVPLLFFGKFTTPYHTIWQINSWQDFIPTIILPAAIGGVVLSLILFIIRKNLQPGQTRSTLYLWFAIIVAAALYYAGPALGLVDIRFVPFGQLTTIIIFAATVGFISQYFIKKHIKIAPYLILLMPIIIFWANQHKGNIPAWTKWNYSGFEEKSEWNKFKQINTALQGDFNDPRVAVENSPDHNRFGSSRAFESLPFFAGRATLEGLYMQASPNAPFVFYIQSLISKESSRPFPQYRYDEMDFNRAKARLALFNVGDVIIRSEAAKNAIMQSGSYIKQKTIAPYELWSLKNNPPGYVVPVDIQPVFYRGKDVKDAAFKWFSRDRYLDIPIIFPQKGQKIPVNASQINSIKNAPHKKLNLPPCEILENIGQQRIDITTTCQDRPLMIKVSYHPNWQVQGADTIYQVTPSFMLIYPKSNKITLSYQNSLIDQFGAFLSGLGIIILIINLPLSGTSRFKRKLTCNLQRYNHRLRQLVAIKPSFKKMTVIATLIILGTGFCLVSLRLERVLQKNPQRLFEAGISDKDSGNFDVARQKFSQVIEAQPLSDMARNAKYYIAACYYLQGLDSDAAAAFNKIIETDPHSPWRASAYYHLGVLSIKHNDIGSGRRYLDIVINNFPKSGVADYAKKRRKNL